MALMNWAIDVPQKLLQSDAKPFLWLNLLNKFKENKDELIIKES
jgi:hypothetical protein